MFDSLKHKDKNATGKEFGNNALHGHLDWYVLIPVLALMLFSIGFVFSASAPVGENRFGGADRLFWNHTLRVGIGAMIMFIFAKIDYHFWKKISLLSVVISIIFLVLVFVIGSRINNAYRWLYIGPINFQPSELAKFALVIHISKLLVDRQELIKNFKYGLMPILIWTCIVVGLIALQPNMSSAAVIFMISMFLMFIGNTNVLHLIYTGLGFLFAGGLYAMIADYRRARVLSWFSSQSDQIDPDKFQITQAIIAFGNGGITGVGAGQSRQSHLFLPESYGDFIFSIIGEEYGFIGVLLILFVFVFIFWRCMKTIKKVPDMFGYYLASGILLTFLLYTGVSTAVNCGVLPTTGLPLPFISYGGTAVIFYSAAMGIFLNISSQANVFPHKAK